MAEKCDVKECKMRSVACAADSQSINFSKQVDGAGGKKWTHVKTQIISLTTFETHDGNENPVKLGPVPGNPKKNITEASLKPDGFPGGLQMKMGKFKDDQGIHDVFEVVWPTQAGQSFPVKAELAIKYASPVDESDRYVEGHKIEIANPEPAKGGCCVIS